MSGAVNVIASLMLARAGQEIAANRTWRIEVALKPLLAERGIDSIEQLVTHLLDGQDASVGDRIVDALLNQETSFFRDPGVIEATAQALGEVTACSAHRPRIWCAGCATGQEPLSLAMHLAETLEAGAPLPEILATDMSAAALARAKTGRFNQFEIQRGLPVRRMIRWFDSAGPAGEWLAKPELLKTITFRRHNLVADRPPAGPFDAILCRNVLFYLTPARRVAVLERMADLLRPGGILVLGAGETVIGLTNRFAPSQRFRGFYEAVPVVAPGLRAGA